MSSDAGPGSETLLSAMVELAAAASEDISPDELLTHLAHIAVEYLHVDGIGVMIKTDEPMRFVHASRPELDDLERLQQLMQEGPCHDALLFQVDVIVDDFRDPVQTAWPQFAELALKAGFDAMVAVPLLSRGRVWGTLDLYRHRVGTWQMQELLAARLLAQVTASYLTMAADRDHARRAEVELAHRNNHDALTGLPNRVLLFDRLAHALHAARRHQRTVAVFFIDLDRFKAVNDTLGHAAGDTVLSVLATRMSATLRDEDTLARLAGDEMVLLCENLPQSDAAELQDHVQAVFERLRRILARPIRAAGVDLVISASIGVAFSKEHLSADDLLADADAAMYRVKQHHHDQLIELGTSEGAAPDPLPLEAVRWHRSTRQLERQLARALPYGQLRVHYQPIVDAAGAVHAVEALLRWQHPDRGLLPAADFIDVAIANGLIVGIGQWVIDQACAQMGRWLHQLGERAPQCVYVNLSARELADPGLTATVATAVDRHGLRPQHLGLELLESAFIDPQVLPNLHEQQRRGHPLSVDDFGTGYSSLSRLVELPVRMAKIDRSLIAGLGQDPRRKALVSAVVTVANSLDLKVIAEGVETHEQAQQVALAGCHYVQGFHCGPPQSAEDLGARWME
jgi:diguanylate cyclase (GGDEF)-like protein